MALRLLALVTSLANRLTVLALAVLVALEVSRSRDGAEGPLFATCEWLVAHPVVALAAAIVVLLLNLNLAQFVAFSFAVSPARAYIPSKVPGGSSRVALSAIRKALRATAAQVPEIARARVRVARLGRHRYRVHVRYLVRDARDAAGAAEYLRLVLKKKFSELVILDPADRVDFDLDLAGIVRVNAPGSEPKRLPSPSRAAGETTRAEPFKGPVYPIEGDVP